MYNALQHAAFLLRFLLYQPAWLATSSLSRRYPILLPWLCYLIPRQVYRPSSRQKNSSFPKRKPFFQLITCAAMSLRVAYAIGFAEVQNDRVITWPTLNKATAALMRQFAHRFAYAGLLILLGWQLARPDNSNRPKLEFTSSRDVAETAATPEHLQTGYTDNFGILSAIQITSMAMSVVVRAVARGNEAEARSQIAPALVLRIHVLQQSTSVFTSA